MATADRVLAVLGLFTMERPDWTVDAVAAELRLSSSTAYHYVRSLAQADLLIADKVGRYTVGPAVIALDRLTRRFDPLIHAAQTPLRDLTRSVDVASIGLLCRAYRLKVMCVDQYMVRPLWLGTSYERGRPMPLTRGAASKIILANLPRRSLRRFYDADPTAVRLAGLGTDWDSFRKAMRDLARPGVATTAGEIDAGVVGVAAPVFGPDGDVIGSIGLVLAQSALADDAAGFAAAIERVRVAGERVTLAMRGFGEADDYPPI